MEKNDELFSLVHSLSKSEKGYFKKFASISSPHGRNIYVRLFDCISGMDIYNETVIREQFKDEKVLSHLTVTKFNLKNLIIRALRNYYEDSIPEVRSVLAMADTHIMLHKGMFQSAQHKISKEKENSVKNEKFLDTLHWINLDGRLITMLNRFVEYKKRAKKIFAEEKKIAEQYINIQEYMYLQVVIHAFIRKPNRQEPDKIRQLLKHHLYSSDKIPTSNQARGIYRDQLSLLYTRIGEIDKARQVGEKMVEFLNSANNRRGIHPFNHFLTVTRLLELLRPQEASKMAGLIEQCRRIMTDNIDRLNSKLISTMQFFILFFEMRLQLYLKKPAEILKTSHKLREYLKKEILEEDRMALSMVLAMTHFLLKEYDKALQHLNLILSAKFELLTPFFADVHFLNIATHAELGNYTIMKRQFAMAKSFAKKNTATAEDELMIINALEQLVKHMESNNKKAVSSSAMGILKLFKSKRIKSRDYRNHIEDWVQTKV